MLKKKYLIILCLFVNMMLTAFITDNELAMFNAIKLNKPDEVRLLLKKGISPYLRDDMGLTLLEIACMEGNLEIVKIFVEENHVSVNSIGLHNSTPLIAAAGSENIEVIQYLLEQGAKVNIHDKGMGATPFLAAKKIEVMELLLKYGADINAQTIYGETQLIRCILNFKNNYEVAKFLLEHGADPNIGDVNGVSVLTMAQRCHLNSTELSKLIKLFIEYKVEINKMDKSGGTALMEAADKNYLDIVKLLIENGADINIKDKKGKTALYFAKNRGFKDIANYLKEHGAIE